MEVSLMRPIVKLSLRTRHHFPRKKNQKWNDVNLMAEKEVKQTVQQAYAKAMLGSILAACKALKFCFKESGRRPTALKVRLNASKGAEQRKLGARKKVSNNACSLT